uniref:phage tailspike protein n=1 Tax=Escherichia coli TaxID=562 RepID=UPI002075F79B
MTDITANVIVSMPSQLFTMARSFKAVANGKIYIGKIDTDPVNPENQIQVYVENEDGSHVPVSQPIIINAAGYPVYNGQIAKFVTVQGHSMAVYDAYGAQQFYFPNVLKYEPDQLRLELESSGGAGLIGGVSKPITFFGAIGDGLTNNTQAFNDAEILEFNDIYIPDGVYNVNNINLNKRYWGPGIVVINYQTKYSGSGVNDMTVSGIYNGQQDLNAIVRIKEASNPDKLEFSTDNGVTWRDTIDVYNPIDDSVSQQPIVILAGGVDFFVSGLKINFSSTTGHTVNDSWSFFIPSNPSVINTGSGSIVKSGSVIFNVSGNNDTNTSAGKDSLGGGNVGANNTAYGWKSLHSNTTGYANTASGIQSMENNKTGKNNCAYGADSLRANVSGSDNVAVGVFALCANTTGYGNTGIGNDTNRYNKTGFGNTAAGVQALYHNSAGNENTAFGEYALRGGNSSFPTGVSIQYCVAVGAKSGFNALGNNNTAIGYEALYSASGSDNVGIGFDAGFKVTAGSFNVFLGSNSGNVSEQATDVTNCVLLGDNTKSTGSNAVAIGSGVIAAQNTVAIGNSEHELFFHYGKITPQIDNAFDIGGPDARYKTIYATTGMINTSNEM